MPRRKEPGSETMTYVHEGLGYTLEYSYYPSDDNAGGELYLARIWRRGKDVSATIPGWLWNRMAAAALEEGRRITGEPPSYPGARDPEPPPRPQYLRSRVVEFPRG